MLGFSTFKKAIKEVSESKLDYFFLFYNLVFFSRIIGFMGTDIYLLINLFIVAFFNIVSKRFIINRYFFYIIAVYIFISTIPIFLFGFSSNLYVGFLVRLLTAYFIITFFRTSFFEKFHNLVYILAYISLPLFVLQVLFRDLYIPLESFTSKIIFDEYKPLNAVYFFIYYINPAGTLRNSGFMSEPSSFGALLAWSMLYVVYRERETDKLKVLIITAITTFSIGTLFYTILILSLYLIISIRTRFSYYFVRVIIPIFVALPIAWNSEIVQDNIKMMEWKLMGEEKNYEQLESGNLKKDQVSRVSGAKINLEYFLKWPFGYGLKPLSSEYKYLGNSPNGLFNIIVKWGIFSVLLLYLSSCKFFKILNGQVRRSYLAKILTMMIFIIPLSGYSFFNQPMMLAIFIWPIVIYSSKRREIAYYQNVKN